VELLTTSQLARRLGLSPSTIRAYAAEGRIPARLTPGGHRRYDPDEVVLALGPGSAPPSLAALRSRRAGVLDAARRHGAANVRVVGSVARGQQGPGSDVDFLVDFEPGRTLLDVAALHDELEELLGCDVDVITSGATRGRLAHVLDEAVAL
jgi:hypothetical protein